MTKITYFAAALAFLNIADAAFSGPFLFWGMRSLGGLEKPTFQPMDSHALISVVNEAKVVVVFESQKPWQLDADAFPRLSELVYGRTYFYTPDLTMTVDFHEAWNKTKIIQLEASNSRADNTITDTFLSLEQEFGVDSVLGLLAGPEENAIVKKRFKREDPEEEKPVEEKNGPYIYNVAGKALFFTQSAPVLQMASPDPEKKFVTYEMKNHDLVTLDDRDQLSRLIITFKLGEGYKVTLRFRFPQNLVYWSLTSVELEDSRGMNLMLNAVSYVPKAPVRFSYKCVNPLIFQNGTTTLTLTNVQVQPTLNGVDRFGDAFDCVGFMTVPIWSGIFVSSILIATLVLSIIAILEVKSSKQFETSKTRLTITNTD